MAEIPSQIPELETECASPSTPNVRKSSRRPAAKKLVVDPYAQYSHKWTVTDKTTLLKALKEFGPTDINNISLKLPNKHPNQIKVFINNIKCKARMATECKIQEGLKNKMSNLKQIIQYIEKAKNEPERKIIDDWFNPSLSIALAIIENMEEHPPATEGICIDYKEAYRYLKFILEFRGGNINSDIMQPVDNMWDIAPCEGQCDGQCHKWKMPDRAAQLRVLEELARTDCETQASDKTEEAVNVNDESNNKAHTSENKMDTENVNVPIKDQTQASEKTKEGVNINEESNNKAYSNENPKEIDANIDHWDIDPCEGQCDGQCHKWKIPDRAALLRVLEELAPTDSETQASDKTEEAVNVNDESNNKAHTSENKMDTENVNVPIKDQTQASDKTKEGVNINEESNNKAYSNENPKEIDANIDHWDIDPCEGQCDGQCHKWKIPDRAALLRVLEELAPTDSETQASDKTEEAVNVNHESNNKSNENLKEIVANKNKDPDNESQGSKKENKNNDPENAAHGKYVKIRQRAKEIVKKKEDALKYAREKRYVADDEEQFSHRTKCFVHQTIYSVLKSSAINFDELNAIIHSKTNEKIPGMYEFNADNPILAAKKDEAEAKLKSYLNQNIHNPLSLSRGTVTAPPKLLSHFLKYYKS